MAEDQDRLRQAIQQVFNGAITSRRQLLSLLLDRRRNIEHECDHPELTQEIGGEYCQQLFDRISVAARVVEVYPKESWQVTPTVYESEDPEVLTPFEAAWASLVNSIHNQDTYHRSEEGAPFWEYLLRADILSGIGRYGVIFLGLDDGLEMNVPASPRDGQKLLYVRCFPETLARVSAWETDPRNPRFGQPTLYQITFADPRSGAVGAPNIDRFVHWTRVVHLADNLMSSEVLGVPRMQQVLGHLLDLRKLYAGSAEMYWLGAFGGISFESHPTLGGDAVVDSSVKDQVENFMHGLQRYLALVGMTAKSLAPQVVDPSPQIERQIEAVCIKLGIPKRVFMGTERGELASSQDDAAWNDRLKHRQKYYLTPRIICPLIDRLIALKVLPEPKSKPSSAKPGKVQPRKASPFSPGSRVPTPSVNEVSPGKYKAEGGYVVCWPDLTSQADQERAAIAMIHTQALSQYAKSNCESYFPLVYFLTTILKLPEELAMEVAQAAEVRRKEVVEEQKDMLKTEADLAPKPAAKSDTSMDRRKTSNPKKAGQRVEKSSKGGN